MSKADLWEVVSRDPSSYNNTCLVSLINLFNKISVFPIGRTSWGSPNISQAVLKLVFLLGNTMTRCPHLWIFMEIVQSRCHNRAESAGVHCQGEWWALPFTPSLPITWGTGSCCALTEMRLDILRDLWGDLCDTAKSVSKERFRFKKGPIIWSFLFLILRLCKIFPSLKRPLRT